MYLDYFVIFLDGDSSGINNTLFATVVSFFYYLNSNADGEDPDFSLSPKHSSIEKKTCAIIESVKKWSRYLSARRFVIVTDQEAVNFMFEARRHGKIKNSKIERWRMELRCYEYDIMYRPGKNNIRANMLSHAQCNTLNNMGRLYEIHENLCHLGLTRLAHLVKVRNLPYSIEEVKRMCAACAVCARWKPRFYTTGRMNIFLFHLYNSNRPRLMNLTMYDAKR